MIKYFSLLSLYFCSSVIDEFHFDSSDEFVFVFFSREISRKTTEKIWPKNLIYIFHMMIMRINMIIDTHHLRELRFTNESSNF